MVTLINRTNERREREEMRRRHIEAAEAAAARDDAEMGLSAPAPARQASNLPEIIGAALEAFGKPLAARLKRMDAQQAEAFYDLKAELIRHINEEMTHELRDMRKATQEHASMRRKQASDAARQACGDMRADIVRLGRELEAARREIEALKQERGNVRSIR